MSYKHNNHAVVEALLWGCSLMYWEKPGKENTVKTVELALKRAKELDLEYVVVASCTGSTAELCLDRGFKIVCVTHHVGFKGPGEDEMAKETRKRLEEKGVKILTAPHLMAGIDRSVRNMFGGLYPAELVAMSLRMLGQGLKVCVEIAGMALDAGYVPYGQDVVAIGGSSEGADTSVIIRPAHSNNFFETKVREIICKPRDF